MNPNNIINLKAICETYIAVYYCWEYIVENFLLHGGIRV